MESPDKVLGTSSRINISFKLLLSETMKTHNTSLELYKNLSKSYSDMY